MTLEVSQGFLLVELQNSNQSPQNRNLCLQFHCSHHGASHYRHHYWSYYVGYEYVALGYLVWMLRNWQQPWRLEIQRPGMMDSQHSQSKLHVLLRTNFSKKKSLL
uniref:Uncharacterized protein n=1 Tax=Lepeophtheirus salmonis TaxID=72036 RepID=A0A0K2TZE5_LEPSM